MQIFDLIPDADVLIKLAPEELAFSLLQVASSLMRNRLVHRDALISIESHSGRPRPYAPEVTEQVELALMESLVWLETNGLLLPAPGSNGVNGFRILSRRGQELVDKTRFDAYRKAAAFPKALLHPAIADRVWIALARGELADAVFIAFRTVEEEVRKAGGYTDVDYGPDLMRRAFHEANGVLSDQAQPKAEREALAHLFAGAIVSLDN